MAGIRWWSPPIQSLLEGDVAVLEKVIKPLGIWKNRAQNIRWMTSDFCNKSWDLPSELRSLGKYADESYTIACLGEARTLREISSDAWVKWLQIYHIEVLGGEG